MPTRDVIKRLEALEETKAPGANAPRLIVLTSPVPKPDGAGYQRRYGGKKLFFPHDDGAGGKSALWAVHSIMHPSSREVLLVSCDKDKPDDDALIIPPCPPDADLSEYARQQVARLDLK